MKELFNFFKGYVIIKVIGDFPERFLNIVTSKNIYVWDIRKAGERVYIMKMSVKAFLKIRQAAYLSGCKVSVIAKKGLLFKIRQTKSLYGIIAGILAFAAVIFYISGTVTDIYVEGNEILSVPIIEQRLEESGLKRFMRKSRVDVEKIKENFKVKYHDVSFIAVNIKGTKAYVQIAEATPKPYIVDDNMPCNIVSEFDGVIETLRVKRGFPAVKEGDTVKKGQLLVSGITDSRFVTVRYVNSDAQIIIRNWRDYIKEFPLKKEIRTKTGRKKQSFEVFVNGSKVKNAKCNFENYSCMQYPTFLNNSLIHVNKVEFYEENVTYETMSLQEAFEWYYNDWLDEIKSGLDESAKVISVRNNFKEDNGKIRIWIELETLEEGGVKQEIKKEEEYGENY